MAAQILCYGKNKEWSYRELYAKLEDRFGSDDRSDEYLAKLETRRRGAKETLQQLCHSIEELVALAYPGPKTVHSDRFAITSFLRALNDAELSGKIRDKQPKTLDEAFRWAQMFDSFRAANSESGPYDEVRKGRDGHAKAAVASGGEETRNIAPKNAAASEQRILSELKALRDEVNTSQTRQLQNQPTFVTNPQVFATPLAPTWVTPQPAFTPSANVPAQPSYSPTASAPPQTLYSPLPSLPTPPAPTNPTYLSGTNAYGANAEQTVPKTATASDTPSREVRENLCFRCKQPGHFRSQCPLSGRPGEKGKGQYGDARPLRRNRWSARTIEEPIVSHSYLQVEVDGVKHAALLDSGCDITVVPVEVAMDKPLTRTKKRLYGVGGNPVPVLGSVKVMMKLGDREIELEALVSRRVTEIMLGIDWMRKHQVLWRFGDGVIEIANQQYLLTTRDNVVNCRRLIAVRDTYVPPRSEANVCTRYNTKGGFGNEVASDWATEPMELKQGLLVARTVLPRRHENLPVRVLNTGDREIYFAKGSEVAEATPVVVETVEIEALAPPSFEHVEPLVDAVDTSVSAEEKSVLRTTLHEFADVFSKSEYDLGCTGLAKHTIDTGDARPIKQTLRRQPFAHLETIDKQVQDMLKTGIIEPSQSPWVSNVVIVTKKDGSARFCVDYRRVNEVTRKDAYPLPRIETCLDALGGARYFSTFDLRSGYHQVKMDEADADKTSFVTRRGTFKFNVLPFGLTNAGATFQRVMDIAMSGLNFSICLVYLDDIILYSSTVAEHLDRLRCLFAALRRANLKLKPSKCSLLQTEVSFLGHVVSNRGIATDPDKIRAVVEWPVPRSVAEVRSFLGLCSYYRRFVESFATVASPLHALTSKARSFEWTEECQRSFEELKRRLTSSPILAMPVDEGKYLLDTDASYGSIGAVLSQIQDGHERVIAYASRTLNKPEQNYCVTRKELLAIVYYMKGFRQYLLGREFVVRTDHAALQWLMRTPTPIGQQARWLDILGEFQFTVVHRPGRSHQNADALSRRPCKQCGAEPEETETLRLCAIQIENADHVAGHEWSVEALAEATGADPVLSVVRSWLQSDEGRPPWDDVVKESSALKTYWTGYDRLKLESNVIYRKWYSHEGIVLRWQLVLPENLRKECIKCAHEGRTGGHLGPDRTAKQVQLRAYWVAWGRDVKTFVRQCEPCVCYKRGEAPKQGYLQAAPVGEPWERVAIDITGPHPVSKAGNRYILTVLDHFSKWTEAFPIRNHEATTVAKILADQVFARFGIPLQLLSDRGPEFEGALLKELCVALGIDKLRTTGYKPSTNGALERFHRTLNSMLAKVVADNHKDWDDRLQSVMAAYRASPHDSTGFTPNFVLLGRECRAPLDLLVGPPPAEAERWGSVDAFVYHQQNVKQQAYAAVREHLGCAAERSKDRYDMRVRPVKFAAGDWVYLYCPRRRQGRNAKWTKYYSGPLLVTKVLGPVNYLVQKNSRSKAQVVHVDKLKKCEGPTPPSWLKPPGVTVSADDPTARRSDVETPPVAVQTETSDVIVSAGDSIVTRSDVETPSAPGITPSEQPQQTERAAVRLNPKPAPPPVITVPVRDIQLPDTPQALDRPRRTIQKPIRYRIPRLYVRRIRGISVTTHPGLSEEAVRVATAGDPVLSIVRGWLEGTRGRPSCDEMHDQPPGIMSYWTNFARLTLSEGIIYRAWYNRQGVVAKWHVVLPKALRGACVATAHVRPTGEHLSVSATSSRLRRKTYWPTLESDTWRFVRSCTECARERRNAAATRSRRWLPIHEINVVPDSPIHGNV